MIPSTWLEQAVNRLEPHLFLTPVTYDAHLNIYLKWESKQLTRSFKVRGALNKVMVLQPWEREKGLVTASAGNHGQGVALAGHQVGGQVIVFASEHAVSAKVTAMRHWGAEVRLVPGGYSEAEETAIAYAQETGAIYISPYNDGHIIAGQGTIGVEISKQTELTDISTCVVPAGGGGLVCGIGLALDTCSVNNKGVLPRLVAVQSEASSFLHSLYYRNTQENVQELPSLADGLAGAVEPGSLTIPLSQRYVDEFILVSEDDIAYAIAYAWFRYGEQIEGSAAVPLAAVLSGKVNLLPAVIIVSGGNIQPEVHREVCDRFRSTLEVERS